MKKYLIITISIVCIVAGILIHVLIGKSAIKLDNELVEFFGGFVFGIGITLPIHLLIKKNKE
jgi:hypothetical protein